MGFHSKSPAGDPEQLRVGLDPAVLVGDDEFVDQLQKPVTGARPRSWISFQSSAARRRSTSAPSLRASFTMASAPSPRENSVSPKSKRTASIERAVKLVLAQRSRRPRPGRAG